MRHTLSASVVAVLLASFAPSTFAQDGTFPPQEPPRGRGGDGPQGERPRGPIDPQQFIDRMMQNDANGDGKLSRDELPQQLAERLFERADTNKDGFLDRTELESAAKSGAMAGGRGAGRGGQAGPGAPGGSPMNLEASMKQINRAYRTLKSSNFDESSRRADLETVQMLQGALVSSKAGVNSMRMSDAAKARFGDDRTKFEAEFRMMLLDTLSTSIELEKAVLSGNGATAKSLVSKLHEMEEKGHELFQPGEGDEAGERREGERPPEGAPRQGPRGSRGRPGGEEPKGGEPRGRPQGGPPGGN